MDRLLRFSSRCLRHPGRGGRRWSLATAVTTQLRDETDPPTTTRPRPKRKGSDMGKLLAKRVSEKLEEGDFKAAVRLASSDDTLAPMSETIF